MVTETQPVKFKLTFEFKLKFGYYGSMVTTSESLLIRLSTDGPPDQTAWRRFVSLYTPLILTWARKMGLQDNDASDLVQDVLTRAFQKLPDFQYDQRKSFRAWLKTVTINRYRETIRRKSAQQSPASHSILEQLQVKLVNAESTWDLDYARLLVTQAMELIREDFADATWQALKCVMSKQMSVGQAASETGVSPWTVYSAKARLMKRLRKELDGLL